MRYHRAFLRSPAGVLLVIGRPGEPTGFLAGTLDNEAHYRWVARHGSPALALAGALALASRLGLVAEFARSRSGRYLRWIARRLRKERSAAPATDGSADVLGHRIAVLTHVAVDERHRGRGAGRDLVGSFVERARGVGAAEARLVTPLNLEASDFYRSLGWRSWGTRSGADGTVVEEFRIAL